MNQELPREFRADGEALEADEARGAGLSARSGARALELARMQWLAHWEPENGPH